MQIHTIHYIACMRIKINEGKGNIYEEKGNTYEEKGNT